MYLPKHQMDCELPAAPSNNKVASDLIDTLTTLCIVLCSSRRVYAQATKVASTKVYPALNSAVPKRQEHRQWLPSRTSDFLLLSSQPSLLHKSTHPLTSNSATPYIHHNVQRPEIQHAALGQGHPHPRPRPLPPRSRQAPIPPLPSHVRRPGSKRSHVGFRRDVGRRRRERRRGRGQGKLCFPSSLARKSGKHCSAGWEEADGLR